MTSVLNQKAARRVSIIAQKPVLVKSATTTSLTAAVVAPTPSKKTAPSSLNQTVVTATNDVSFARKDKEMLEQQISSLRKSVQENEDKSNQLASHVSVLEDLLDQKKEQLEFVEVRLEAMGIDPISVTTFEMDATVEREIYLREQAVEFDERMKQLKQNVNRRNELIAETVKTLKVISESLEELEKLQ